MNSILRFVRSLICGLLGLFLGGWASAATYTDANWVSLGGIPGANGPVHASVTDADGNLYIGGSFTVVGNTLANGVAKWNGSEWTALGEGVSPIPSTASTGTIAVNCLAIVGDDLFVGGSFTHAGGVESPRLARWNLRTGGWTSGGVKDGEIRALHVVGGDLFVGGQFNLPGEGSGISQILSKWREGVWTPVSDGTGRHGVRAITSANNVLYIGGDFTRAGGIEANSIARWRMDSAPGTGWSPLQSGLRPHHEGGGVHALQVVGDSLYVGGRFEARDLESPNIVRWSITSEAWMRVPADLRLSAVYSFAAHGTDLFVGGFFNDSSITGYYGVAKWDTAGSGIVANWSRLGSGADGAVNTLRVIGDSLFVGGGFRKAGGRYGRNNLARWRILGPDDLATDANWSPPMGPANVGVSGTGARDVVSAVAVIESDLYVGGVFQSVGGIAANNIAKWDGTRWSPLGAGAGTKDDGVISLLAHEGSLIVGGSDGTKVWDGGQLRDVGPDASVGPAKALLVVDNVLYSATRDAGVRRYPLAQGWGGTWSSLNGPMVAANALATDGRYLYAGGAFTSLEGVPGASRIARWDLVNGGWSALGTGVGDGAVNALAVTPTHLIVGGSFTTIHSGSDNKNIARWRLDATDNSGWLPMGSGVTVETHTVFTGVNALAVIGNELFVGGNFLTAGGQAGRVNIAKWNLPGSGDASWEAVGSGVAFGPWIYSGSSTAPGGVRALARTAAGELYVGGSFEIAGGKAAGNVALLVPANEPPTVTLAAPALAAVGRPVLLQATASDPGGTVNKVEFFAGNTKLGEAPAEPFEHTTIALGLGNHDLIAVATDNRGLTATSAPVRITLLLPPSITVEPPPTASFNALTSGDFGVVAAGSDPLSYQWLFNGNPLPDATTATMSFVNIRLDQEGDYRVVVSNPVGSVTSRVVKVTVVLVPPSIVQQPRGGFVGPGDRFLFSVIPQGTQPFTFQWQLRGTNLPGATGQDLSLSNATVQDAGAYRVIVSNAAGSLASDPAHLAYFGDLQLIASLVLAGEVGQTVRVEFSDALAPGAGDWLVLTNISLPHSPFLVIDPTSRGKPNRYYRAVKP